MRKKIGLALAAIVTLVALQWAVASVDTQPALTQQGLAHQIKAGAAQSSQDPAQCPVTDKASCSKCPKSAAAGATSCPSGDGTKCPVPGAAKSTTSGAAKCPYTGSTKI